MPDEYRLARADRFEGWNEADLTTRHGYLGLEPADGVDQIHALKTDARATSNLNPLSATMRERNTTIDLLFDSLGTVNNGEIEPWLATSWDWTEPDASEQASTLTATVTLREDCQFHDGEPLTPEDVAFTYRFLEDTSLGRAPSSPAPRYQGHVDVINEISVDDDAVDGEYELLFSFEGGREAAKRAFTVPILPKHYWHDLVDGRAADGEFIAPQGRWIAVTGTTSRRSEAARSSSTVEPKTSNSASPDTRTTLRSVRTSISRADRRRTPIRYRPQQLVSDQAGRRRECGRDGLDALRIHVGRDSRHPGRRTVEIHLENLLPYRIQRPQRTLQQHALPTSGFAIDRQGSDRRGRVLRTRDPVATPVTDEWIPESLEWNGEDPVLRFLGSDGELNVEAAKATFESAGFRYDDNGRLLGGYWVRCLPRC